MYGSVTPLPNLDTFFHAFKRFYLKKSNENGASDYIENIKQGKMSVSEYSTEFKMQLSELGTTSAGFEARFSWQWLLRSLPSMIWTALSL